MVNILKEGAPYESLLVSFVLTCAHGSLVSSSSRIIDSLLGTLLTKIHSGSLHRHQQQQQQRAQQAPQQASAAELPDFVASALVRLYVRICREYGFLVRARTLIFDILREKEEICLSQLMGGISAWPLVVESRKNSSRSFVSCTTEAILTAALTAGTSDSLVQLQLSALQTITGWKMESRKQLLPRWSEVLLSSVSAFFSHTEAYDMATSYALGLDLVHSLELLGTQLGWTFCLTRIWRPLIWPSLASFTSQLAAEDLSQSASQLGMLSFHTSVLIKAAVAISRIGIESGQLSLSEATAPLLNMLLPNTPVTFTLQIQAAQAIFDTLLAQKAMPPRASADFSALCGWYGRLPSLQRRYLPSRLESLLQM